MFTPGAAHSGDHLARFVWHQNQAITADPTGLQRSLEHRNVRIGLSRGIGSYQTAFFVFFQRQSQILGRMHLTGVRSGVRQSETKRTGMRRRSLADAPFKTKTRAFMKENTTHKLTTVYPHRVGVAD